MPPFLHWPWAVPDLAKALAPPRGAAQVPAYLAEEPLPTLVDQFPREDTPMPAEAHSIPAAFLVNANEPDPAHVPENISRPALSWLSALATGLWLAGTGFVCGLQGVRIGRFRRLLRHPAPAPRWLDHQVAQVAALLRVRPPRLRIVAGIRSPFLWSLGRPTLLWPTALLESLPRSAQRSIVVHELAHLRRRDHWVGWLQLLAECLWWWNTCFWYVRRQLRLQAELACDVWVVTTLPQERRAYAETLIAVTQLLAPTAAPLPALGIRSAARHDFERRLTMIMRERVPCCVPWVAAAAVGFFALLTLPGWSQTTVREGKDVSIASVSEDFKGAEVSQKTVEIRDDFRADAAFAKPEVEPDRDARLRQLERQLQALLKEVQSLRSDAAKPQARFQDGPAAKTATGAQKGKPVSGDVFRADQQHAESRSERVLRSQDGKQTTQEITLVRVRYALPSAKAEALANLLTQHNKREILEINVEKDSLIIITTPAAQQAISQFISLLQGGRAIERSETRTSITTDLEVRPRFRFSEGEDVKKPSKFEAK